MKRALLMGRYGLADTATLHSTDDPTRKQRNADHDNADYDHDDHEIPDEPIYRAAAPRPLPGYQFPYPGYT